LRGKNPVAIYLHGNGSASVFESVEKTTAYAEALTRQGIAFFAFNNRGSGYVRKLKRDVPDPAPGARGTIEEETRGGTAYEVIADCVKDIEGAIEYLKRDGFDEFFLIGESTGANKIVVYDSLKPQNPVSRYVLVAGGDDTGIYYNQFGPETFRRVLGMCATEIRMGRGGELVPKELLGGTLMSWRSLRDTIDPEGLYNVFPYNDIFNGLALSTKQPLAEYAAITKPVFVVYGEHDEFCYGKVPQIVALLKERSSSRDFASLVVPGGDHGLSGLVPVSASAVASWLAGEEE
jgi:pimeloyl-ACP methyl ester carboxylesterase